MVVGFSGNLGEAFVFFGELMAIKHGLLLARNNGITQLICHSDSKMAVDLISEGFDAHHLYAAMVED